MNWAYWLPPPLDPMQWLAVMVTLVAAGAVKGAIGFGLPLVAVSVLSNIIEVRLALALMIIPIVVSNLWLGVQGGRFGAILAQHWPLVLAVGAGIFVGAWLIVGIDSRILLALVGVVVVLFALVEYFKPGTDKPLPAPLQRPVGVIAGLLSGVLGGITTAYGPVLLIYLTSLRMPKEVFVSTVGTIWFFASMFLVVAFSAVKILTPQTALLSTAALLPVFAGLYLGRRLRGRVDQRTFQRITLAALMLLGLNLLRRALW